MFLYKVSDSGLRKYKLVTYDTAVMLLDGGFSPLYALESNLYRLLKVTNSNELLDAIKFRCNLYVDMGNDKPEVDVLGRWQFYSIGGQHDDLL